MHSERGTPAERPGVSPHASPAKAAWKGAFVGFLTALFIVALLAVWLLLQEPEHEEPAADPLIASFQLFGRFLEGIFTGIVNVFLCVLGVMLTLLGGAIGAAIGAVRHAKKLAKAGQLPKE